LNPSEKPHSPAASGITSPRFGEVAIRDRGRLPHWEAEGSAYFVTFHLADSLPRSVFAAWTSEREAILKRKRPLSPAEKKRLQDIINQKAEAYLDSGAGACWLARPEVAGVVRAALLHFEGRRYRLFAWCIMPNHVHAVFRPLRNHRLAGIMHSWKSYTASEANRLLGRIGAFWQREYYDHLIRNEEDFQRVVRYVALNPEKANLPNWPWVWILGL